jgi:hypothetical protein
VHVVGFQTNVEQDCMAGKMKSEKFYLALIPLIMFVLSVLYVYFVQVCTVKIYFSFITGLIYVGSTVVTKAP